MIKTGTGGAAQSFKQQGNLLSERAGAQLRRVL